MIVYLKEMNKGWGMYGLLEEVHITDSFGKTHFFHANGNGGIPESAEIPGELKKVVFRVKGYEPKTLEYEPGYTHPVFISDTLKVGEAKNKKPFPTALDMGVA